MDENGKHDDNLIGSHRFCNLISVYVFFSCAVHVVFLFLKSVFTKIKFDKGFMLIKI